MKKTIYLIILFLMPFLLTSCNFEYEGKEIISIQYVSIDYNGGYRVENIIDLEKCEVLKRGYLPLFENEELPDFEVANSFEKEDITKFLNELNRARFFEIAEEYPTPGGIVDGGGWVLTINYADDTFKISTGDNNAPRTVFKKCDYAFYNLYGEDLFGTLPSSYKLPPALDISFNYSYDKTSVSDGRSLSHTNATWNKYNKEGINNIEFAIANQKYEFLDEYDYKFVIWTANNEFKFSKFEIMSYDLNGADEKLIVSAKWFSQKEWDLEFNRVYVITETYSKGIVQYAFATKQNI